eukprot:TRINITY_DN24034_c0_g1_i1.p1 TRINITY_DN24034_c0_g1~~TRINITY_DN24034_c0_g1_i1.p1  ORF type:complete len:666 (+),score=161.00 TRINITY_DN24034_c0_g1_i1:122-2119(+)
MMLAALERSKELVLLEPRCCPRRCGEFVLGKNYQDHVELYCPLREAVCLDGCGATVVGCQLDAHSKVCPMVRYLEQAEVAVRESSLKECRLALASAYAERDKAYARMEERGERVDRKKWPTYRCAERVQVIESTKQKLTTKLRRKAKDRMESALTYSADDGSSGTGSALKMVDPTDEEALYKQASRGSRPWDLTAPLIENLAEVLQEAAVCGADESLRRACEKLLLASLRRMLEAAIASGDHTTLVEANRRTEASLVAIELESLGEELPPLLRETMEAIHHAALRNIDDSAPEFFEALAKGDVEMCAMFLRHEKANPSALEPKSGLPAIVAAAKAGDIPMCRVLMEQKADVNARCEVDGLSALHWAAHWRHARTMEVLLHGGANPRLKDWRGQDSLMKLLRRSFNAPARSCEWSWDVRHSSSPLAGDELDGSGMMDLETARTRAETDSNCIGFCFLRGEGDDDADLFHVSLRGTRPLDPMASSGAQAAPPSPTAALAAREQPSEDELWTSYLKVPMEVIHDLRVMLAFGADCGAQDESGLTALHHHLRSAPCGGSAEVVGVLLKNSADVNHKCITDRRASPLLLAVANKRADLVRVMLKDAFPPADVDIATPEGISALALAESQPGGAQVAQLLREAGASSWSGTEMRLGANTTFSFDTRKPVRT